MEISDLISKHFNFLLSNGFQLVDCFNWGGFEYAFTFADINDCKIKIDVDLRNNFVDIKIKKGVKVLLHGLIIRHEFNGLKDMLSAREIIYTEINKSRRGLSEKKINALLALYADFIKTNFENITGRTRQLTDIEIAYEELKQNVFLKDKISIEYGGVIFLDFHKYLKVILRDNMCEYFNTHWHPNDIEESFEFINDLLKEKIIFYQNMLTRHRRIYDGSNLEKILKRKNKMFCRVFSAMTIYIDK